MYLRKSVWNGLHEWSVIQKCSSSLPNQTWPTRLAFDLLDHWLMLVTGQREQLHFSAEFFRQQKEKWARRISFCVCISSSLFYLQVSSHFSHCFIYNFPIIILGKLWFFVDVNTNVQVNFVKQARCRKNYFDWLCKFYEL